MEGKKHLKEQQKSDKDVSEELVTSLKEQFETEQNLTDVAIKHQAVARDSMKDILLKTIADQGAELERLCRDSQALKEKLEKLTENNTSLVKQNIALRRQVRVLKTSSLTPSSLTSPLPHTHRKTNPVAPQRGEDIAKTDQRQESPSRAKDAVFPQAFGLLPRLPNISGLAKFKEKLEKLLGIGGLESARRHSSLSPTAASKKNAVSDELSVAPLRS